MDRSEWVLVQEARDYHGGFWPAELTSGVMFWKGTRITRDEFTRGPLTSPVAPPPPAEQASGEHVAVLREFAEDYRRYIPQFHAQNRKRMKRNLADLDAAIAALSQRPVVGDVRILARDIHYAIADDGLAPARPADNVAMREAILRVLTLALQQPEKGEDDDDSDRDPCEVCLDRSCNGECGGDCP